MEPTALKHKTLLGRCGNQVTRRDEQSPRRRKHRQIRKSHGRSTTKPRLFRGNRAKTRSLPRSIRPRPPRPLIPGSTRKPRLRVGLRQGNRLEHGSGHATGPGKPSPPESETFPESRGQDQIGPARPRPGRTIQIGAGAWRIRRSAARGGRGGGRAAGAAVAEP
uniref:NPAP n=1 Tax=Arundo donax TaxID=35708 RepID=A0A0A9LCS8_ARUDO